MSNKFISIEGIEGAGKSTALQFIKNYLINLSFPVVVTREPGGTPLAEQIRTVLLHPLIDEKMSAETELLLMFAARAQHIQQVIKPALQAGSWVITDRYVDASFAYQGGGRGVDEKQIAALTQWIVGPCMPVLTIYMDISPEQGFARAEKRGTEKDRIEQEQIAFFDRVRHVYLDRAAKDSARIKIIDASSPLFTVENQLRGVLDEFIMRQT